MTPELRLRDGRPVGIGRVQIEHSTAGILAGAAELIWDDVVKRSPYSMDRNQSGLPPAYVVLPISTVPGRWILPTWKVSVELCGEPLEHAGRSSIKSGFSIESSVVMVFFCDDISSSPLTAFIAAQVAELDEEVWIRHAWNGW